MPSASIRFYAELNDHLSLGKRYNNITISIEDSTSLRELIQSLGVLCDDVDLVLVNGESVDLHYILSDNDRVSVYPVYESFDISSLTKIRERPLRQPRFVLDCHLGKLAYYLRMLGFDTLYRSDFHDDELIAISNTERRTLLSRDRRLIEESSLTRAFRVRETNPRLQVVEVLRRFDLFGSTRPLQRCLRCNMILSPINKGAVLDRLLPMVKERYEEFQTCLTCNRVYWKGSHYQRMQAFIAMVLSSEPLFHVH